MAIVTYAKINDVHIPYHDRIRYKVAMKIFKSLTNLRGIYLNGDIGEFQGVGSWPTHPTEKGLTFIRELDLMNKMFDDMVSDFQGIPVTYIEGNHEYRFYRYIRDVAPAMWGTIDCPALLKFHERPGWKFVPYGPSQWQKCGASNLYLRHEPLAGGKNHASGTAENSYVDVAYGHTHTYQTSSHKKNGPKPFITKAYSCGWLGDKTRNCFDYRGAKDNWVEGCTVIECDDVTGEYTLDFIDLRRLPVLWRGQRFDAK